MVWYIVRKVIFYGKQEVVNNFFDWVFELDLWIAHMSDFFDDQ